MPLLKEITCLSLSRAPSVWPLFWYTPTVRAYTNSGDDCSKAFLVFSKTHYTLEESDFSRCPPTRNAGWWRCPLKTFEFRRGRTALIDHCNVDSRTIGEFVTLGKLISFFNQLATFVPPESRRPPRWQGERLAQTWGTRKKITELSLSVVI